jgi:thymidylate synthase
MAWPLYFAQNLTLGNPESGVGLCLLWTPQDRVLPELNSADYAVAGNLYSRDGVSYLLRNLLARPTLRTILLCGKDMTGSGAALAALFANGVDAQGRIIGEGTRLHAEIPHEAIELVRRNVTLHDARDVVRAPQVAELLAQLRCAAAPFAPAPLEFPYTEPAAAALPAADLGMLLRAPTIRAAYLKLLWHVLAFGKRTGTQHSADQRELLDVLTVVSDEPTDPERCSYADWMPFTRESLGARQADGRYTGYLGQILDAQGERSVSYTYGARMRAFDGAIDQISAIVAQLRAAPQSRRAVAVLWSPADDAHSPNPPCLNLVQARLRHDKLHLTAYFRSHDIYRAWAPNAFGLRTLQGQIAAELGVPAGDLAILSQSAHVYAHDWEAASDLTTHHYRAADPRLVRDDRGSFVIALEPPEIVVRHYTPEGEHLQTWRGASARELGLLVMAYVGETSHAIYLGMELQKAELAITLNQPAAYRQDRPLALDH